MRGAVVAPAINNGVRLMEGAFVLLLRGGGVRNEPLLRERDHDTGVPVVVDVVEGVRNFWCETELMKQPERGAAATCTCFLLLRGWGMNHSHEQETTMRSTAQYRLRLMSSRAGVTWCKMELLGYVA